MKTIILTLQEFLEGHGLKMDTIQLKLSDKGEIEYCTGTFTRSTTIALDIPLVSEDFKNKIKLMDKRFDTTELEVTHGNQFILTNNANN